jgi:hypothetical protein
MSFCALAMKTFWRMESLDHWRWHCFIRRGKEYVSLCAEFKRAKSSGQKKWRPPDIRRCHRCDNEELKLFERLSGKTRDMSLDESPDWRDGEDK